MKLLQQNDAHFGMKTLEGADLLTHDGKICIPDKLQGRVLSWCHECLAHPGETRTEETIRQFFTWPSLSADVKGFVKSCKTCQKCKKSRAAKCGKLPARLADTVPWERANVDLIGPWTVKTPTKTHKLQAITMIDPATGWFEMAELKNKEAWEAMDIFDKEWLCRHPRPRHVGMDGGSEFKKQFRETCENCGLTRKTTTPHNPQGNSVVERIHQAIGDSLRTFKLEGKELDEEDPFGPFLASASWAVRSTCHATHEATPGQLAFGRDVLLGIEFNADWASIAKR